MDHGAAFDGLIRAEGLIGIADNNKGGYQPDQFFVRGDPGLDVGVGGQDVCVRGDSRTAR